MPFWRASRSSARNEAWPRSGVGSSGRLGLEVESPARGHLLAIGGVDPGGQHAALGGALRVRCDDRHRSVKVAGVDPASWTSPETA